MKVQEFTDFKPEAVTSYEIGYRGLLAKSRLLVDAYAYIGNYQDFITRVVVAQSITATPSPADILVASKEEFSLFPSIHPPKLKLLVGVFHWNTDSTKDFI